MRDRRLLGLVRVGLNTALALAFAIGTTGCSTSTVMSTAPAQEAGWRYAVGQHAGHPAAWVCPEVPGQGECRAVEIDAEER
jgi:hypothetical protein